MTPPSGVGTGAPPSKPILVVEDELDQRELLLELLQHEGYRAVGAARAREALSAVAKECPAIVLCDVILPDMDGRELCKCIREACPEPPAFIFLTGVAPTKTEDIPHRHLLKPVTVETLLEEVARHVRRGDDGLKNPGS